MAISRKSARAPREAAKITDELIAKIDSKDPVYVLAQLVTSLTGVIAEQNERLTAIEQVLEEEFHWTAKR